MLGIVAYGDFLNTESEQPENVGGSPLFSPTHSFLLKETQNSCFCATPQNHQLMLFSWNILKNAVTKKVIVCFYNLSEENFYKSKDGA